MSCDQLPSCLLQVLSLVLILTALPEGHASWEGCEDRLANYSQTDVEVNCTYNVPSSEELKLACVRFPVGRANPALYNRGEYEAGDLIYEPGEINKNNSMEVCAGKQNGRYQFKQNEEDDKVTFTLYIEKIEPQTLRPYQINLNFTSGKTDTTVIHLQRDPNGMTLVEYTNGCSMLRAFMPAVVFLLVVLLMSKG